MNTTQERKTKKAATFLDGIVEDASELVLAAIRDDAKATVAEIIKAGTILGPDAVVTKGQACVALARGPKWLESKIARYGVPSRTENGVTYYIFGDLMKARDKWFRGE